MNKRGKVGPPTAVLHAEFEKELGGGHSNKLPSFHGGSHFASVMDTDYDTNSEESDPEDDADGMANNEDCQGVDGGNGFNVDTVNNELKRLTIDMCKINNTVSGFGEKMNNFEMLLNGQLNEAKQAHYNVTEDLKKMETRQKEFSKTLSQNSLMCMHNVESLQAQSSRMNHLKKKNDQVQDMNNKLINIAHGLEDRVKGIKGIDIEEKIKKQLKKAKRLIEDICLQQNSIRGKCSYYQHCIELPETPNKIS